MSTSIRRTGKIFQSKQPAAAAYIWQHVGVMAAACRSQKAGKSAICPLSPLLSRQGFRFINPGAKFTSTERHYTPVSTSDKVASR